MARLVSGNGSTRTTRYRRLSPRAAAPGADHSRVTFRALSVFDRKFPMSRFLAHPAAKLQLFVALAVLGSMHAFAQRAFADRAMPSAVRARSTPASGAVETVVVIGAVRDTAGNPISNVRVVVSGVDRVALTDNRGEFVFRGLPAGTYHLDLVRIGYRAEHELITVPADGPDVRVNDCHAGRHGSPVERQRDGHTDGTDPLERHAGHSAASVQGTAAGAQLVDWTDAGRRTWHGVAL